MPLNERHFNGSRLLKHFIRVSSMPVDTLEPLGPSQQKQKSWRDSLWSGPLLVRTPSHKAFGMEIWLALTFFSSFFWLHTTLRPCFHVTFGAEAWSHINIRGIREQRDTQDLAAEEQIRTKAMDVPRPFLLLLCALYLTCKYCLLHSFELLLRCVQKQLFTQWTDANLLKYTCLTLVISLQTRVAEDAENWVCDMCSCPVQQGWVHSPSF